MLHLLHEVSSVKRSGARLVFNMHILHIDTGAAFNNSLAQRQNHVATIKQLCSGSYPDTPLTIVNMEDLLFNYDEADQKSINFNSLEIINEERAKRCYEYLQSFNSSLSAKEDVLRAMVLQSIVKATHCTLDQRKVLVGESGNNLAIRTISNISKGRGYTIPLVSTYSVEYPVSTLVGSFDANKVIVAAAEKTTQVQVQVQVEQQQEKAAQEKQAKQVPKKVSNKSMKYTPAVVNKEIVTILRPMKDFLNKEIAYYNHLLKLQTVHVPNATTMMPIKTSSIDKLVEHFINHLQTDYPATVHTLLRTAEKLKTPAPKQQDLVKYCAMCNDYLTENEANELQQYLVNKYTSKNENDEAAAAPPSVDSLDIDRHEFAKFCCYGCKRVISSKSGSLMNILDELQIEGFAPSLASAAADAAQQEQSQDSKNINLANAFPSHVGRNVQSVKKKLTRAEMKDQIKDFLIE